MVINIKEDRKSPPVHMNSYPEKIPPTKKKGNNKFYNRPKKDYNEEFSYDQVQDQSVERLQRSNPSIRGNFLTINDINMSSNNIQ